MGVVQRSCALLHAVDFTGSCDGPKEHDNEVHFISLVTYFAKMMTE